MRLLPVLGGGPTRHRPPDPSNHAHRKCILRCPPSPLPRASLASSASRPCPGPSTQNETRISAIPRLRRMMKPTKGQRASVEPKEPILERLPRTARSLIGRDDTAYHRRARPQGRSSNTLAVRPSQSRDRENPPRPLARMALPVPVSSPDCMIRPRARACPHS